MLPYFILVLVPTIIWILNDRVQLKVGDNIIHETKSLSIDVFMIIFICLIAFRGLECGTDTAQYRRIFEQYSSQNIMDFFNSQTHEIGYKILNKLIGSITDQYQFLLIATSLFYGIPLWYFYKKESEMPILTLALFLSVSPFVMFFSGIRQSMAMAIGVLAWYTAKEKKLVKFILCVIFAMLFHTSAIMLFAIYPLYHAKITKKWLGVVVPAIFGVYYFRKPIFNFAIDFLWKDYNVTEETGAVTILFLLIIFAIYSYVIVDDKLLDQDTIALRNLLLLSIVIQIFAMLHPLSMRMNYYFLIFIPILIPKIAKRCKKEYTIIGTISVCVMTVYFLYYFLNMVVTDNDKLNIFPYIPFWDNL